MQNVPQAMTAGRWQKGRGCQCCTVSHVASWKANKPWLKVFNARVAKTKDFLLNFEMLRCGEVPFLHFLPFPFSPRRPHINACAAHTQVHGWWVCEECKSRDCHAALAAGREEEQEHSKVRQENTLARYNPGGAC